MNLNKWLFGAAALAMMASCSDDISNAPTPTAPAEEGQGYIGINIQLPKVNGTRVNDDFGDGEVSEYSVNDAVLLLFQGADEATATCTGVYNLREAEPSYDDSDQVTRHSIRVANVKDVNKAQNLYAMVMVNGIANELYTKENPTAPWMKGKTVKNLQEYIFDQTKKLYTQTPDKNDFASDIFMVNSPLSEVSGGSNNPGTISNSLPVLVQLDPTTYPTQSQAIANPAGTIHVERAVAKVTCSEFTKGTDLVITVNGKKYELVVDNVSWDMAQDMAKTYVVRNTSRDPKVGTDRLWYWNLASEHVTTNKYRMLGSDALSAKVYYMQPGENEGDKPTLASKNTSFYRPYFCQVPDYGNPVVTTTTEGEGDDAVTTTETSTVYENKTFTKTTMEAKDAINMPSANSMAFASAGAFYPRENTFPVEFMKYANTTRVGFWVSFKFNPIDGGPAIGSDVNFYIKGMDKSTLYLDDADGNDPLTNRALAKLSDQEDLDNTALWEAVSNALDKNEAGTINNVELQKLITIEYKKEADGVKDGLIAIKSISFKSLDDLNRAYPRYFAARPSFTFSSSTIQKLNNLGEFRRYKGGKVFYETRIMHFGDDLTPWVPTTETATNIDQSYGEDATKRNNNYLGRYGIVRNNWYDIKVTAIKNLGYPEDPAKWDDSWPGKPDDNKDQYIAVELRVLSWAKRSQNVEF